MTAGQAEALRLSAGLTSSAAVITRVAKATSAEDAAWAFQQWELRKRASAKFSAASEMLFHREALEQATHEVVARFHASQFPTDVLVADLTAGIGADLLALADRGPVLGFELDATRADYARYNLSIAREKTAEVRVEDSVAWLSTQREVEYAFADPARRVEGRRTLDLGEFQPNPYLLAEHMSRLRLGLIKLSPLLRDEDLAKIGPTVRFVSSRGECREALIYLGREAPTGSGAVLAASGEFVASGGYLTTVAQPDQFIFDVDAAAVRAHALETLASPSGLTGLGDSPGYLTGPNEIESPWWKSYRMLASEAFDLKRLRARLAEAGASTPILKQRGTKLDLIATEKKLQARGSEELTVIFFLVGKSIRYALTEPRKNP